MCTDMCIDMGIDMGIDMCIDMRIDVRMDVSMGTCMYACIDVCISVCMDVAMRVDVFVCALCCRGCCKKSPLSTGHTSTKRVLPAVRDAVFFCKSRRMPTANADGLGRSEGNLKTRLTETSPMPPSDPI